MTKKKENKEVNIIDPNPNNSYKTKKKFTGSYTEVNPEFCKECIPIKVTNLVLDLGNDGAKWRDWGRGTEVHGLPWITLDNITFFVEC